MTQQDFKKIIADFISGNFRGIICLAILAAAGVFVYRGAFGNTFIFDDLTQILENTKIQSLHWPWEFLFNNRRPVLYATLAWNFHGYGFNPFGYHAFNIRGHILAAMMFFLLVRKTLLLPRMNGHFTKEADWLALSAALLWELHPMLTQAVTYIIQRVESLMGLLFLSAMFFAAQYMTSRKIFWLIIAAVFSLLAGLTKEVTLVLPVMVLFYDRTFISDSFLRALKDHGRLYLALSVTWIVMIFLYLTTRPEEHLTAGFGMKGMTPLLYLSNQPAVILHYLRLIVWPAPLVFDYEWPARTGVVLWPSQIVLVTWIAVLAVFYRKWPAMGFLGLGFLILLLPSSSIIPLKDLIFEYRIYLSLTCAAAGFVLLLWRAIQNFVPEKKQTASLLAMVSMISIIYGGVTFQRNKVFQSEEKVWLDVIRKQPDNARAYNNLGEYWLRHGRINEAEQCFLESMTLNGKYPDVFANMATALGKQGRITEAIKFAKQAIIVSPDFAVGYNNLGSAYSQTGEFDKAVPNFEKALSLGFIKEGVFVNLAAALANDKRPFEAVKVIRQGLTIYPDSVDLREIEDKILHPNMQK